MLMASSTFKPQFDHEPSMGEGILVGPLGAPDDRADILTADMSLDGSTAVMEYLDGPDPERRWDRHRLRITINRPDGRVQSKTFTEGDDYTKSGNWMPARKQATRWMRRMGFPEVLVVGL